MIVPMDNGFGNRGSQGTTQGIQNLLLLFLPWSTPQATFHIRTFENDVFVYNKFRTNWTRPMPVTREISMPFAHVISELIGSLRPGVLISANQVNNTFTIIGKKVHRCFINPRKRMCLVMSFLSLATFVKDIPANSPAHGTDLICYISPNMDGVFQKEHILVANWVQTKLKLREPNDETFGFCVHCPCPPGCQYFERQV